jgi:hypothetical protein
MNHPRFARLLMVLQIALALLLLVIGAAIILGPKFPEGFIHIRLVRGHAITTQDVIALIPLLLGAYLLLRMGWSRRMGWLRLLQTNPARGSALLIGCGAAAGLFVGLLLGILYENQISYWLRNLSLSVQSAFAALGLLN